MTTTTTTTTSGQQCLPLLLLLLCLLSGLSAAHQLPSDTASVSDHHSSSVLVALIQQLFQQQTSMIDRLRTDLADFKKEQKSANDQLRTDLADYKKEQASVNDQVQTDLADYKKEQTSVIDQVQTDLADYKKEQASVNDQVQTDLTNYKKQVDSPSVAFTARISHSKDKLALAPQQTIVFDDVITNAGSAYDPRHGIFTAPSSGTYVFFLSTMAVTGSSSVHLRVLKNGSVLDGVWAEGNGEANDQGSTQVTAQLTTGDQVWVRQAGGNKVRASWWTVFSGFKLH